MALAKGEFAGNAAACYRSIYNRDDRLLPVDYNIETTFHTDSG
jgi:hypothetical protein